MGATIVCVEQIVDEQMLRGWTILTDVATAAHWQERRGSLTGGRWRLISADGGDRELCVCPFSTSRHKRKAYAVHFAVERVRMVVAVGWTAADRVAEPEEMREPDA
ncbi:uncharacterized protein EMH_0097640 [Eimeria mitis]|uniref:Uncharacterized protein n=1 Tax=Eimeria mitis TaxID=44415 RepID=U6KJ37_9EIME|nr:uncharacterized protein EMH_0097640 [Eimeria mitis]CDJ35458.1 hypothetical protein, conserved [Eimeria mitis]